jgi:hypothetical protein
VAIKAPVLVVSADKQNYLVEFEQNGGDLFEEKQVRRAWNKDEQKWYFAIPDVIAFLTGSVDPGAYWRKLK